MNLASFVWLQLCAVLILQPSVKVSRAKDLELVANGYENLIVTVNPDVNPTDRSKLISGIQVSQEFQLVFR